MSEKTDTETPGMTAGLAGIVLEPYYFIFGPTIKCPKCGSHWRGYYSQYMNYCHFCGVEVVKND